MFGLAESLFGRGTMDFIFGYGESPQAPSQDPAQWGMSYRTQLSLSDAARISALEDEVARLRAGLADAEARLLRAAYLGRGA